jgi:uncharacterized membrane protein
VDLTLALKFLHVVGAAILFGTGLGIAFFQFRANRKDSPATIAATLRTVVVADYLFTATAAILQPLTGLALAHLRGYEIGQTWIALSLALYVLIGLCWLPVVVLQIRMRDLAEAAVAAGELVLPPHYHALARAWFWLGWQPFADADDFLADDRQARLIAPRQTRARPTLMVGRARCPTYRERP